VVAVVAIALVALAVLGWLIFEPILRERRRAAARREPLPPLVREHVERNVPALGRLPAPLRARLDGLVNVFVAEKDFVGCNGLEVDDEMRGTIAAQACLLILGRPGSVYDELRSILVYPTPFWVEEEIEDEAGVVSQRRRVLSGQAWDSSRIILSWEDISEAADYPADGYNLVLHEFAHYLDAEGRGLAAPRTADGRAPRPRSIERWAEDLGEEFDALLVEVENGLETFLDPYAAEDEAEFFAVATEEFFERPAELRREHARLYALMQEFYGLDPAGWSERRRSGADGAQDGANPAAGTAAPAAD
jgi:Mlc titration factor MtfA (ptsG expression regulator)